MFKPFSVNRVFAGSFLTFGFLAVVGCAAILFTSGCGEVTTTPDDVAAENNVIAPPVTEPKPKEEDRGGNDSTFVWKPISASDRKLAVVTPYQYSFTSLDLTTAAGVTEQGNYVGRSNGNRQTWRFSKQGAEYGQKITVAGHGPDKSWDIPDGAAYTKY